MIKFFFEPTKDAPEFSHTMYTVEGNCIKKVPKESDEPSDITAEDFLRLIYFARDKGIKIDSTDYEGDLPSVQEFDEFYNKVLSNLNRSGMAT